jgi:hypothetical protein
MCVKLIAVTLQEVVFLSPIGPHFYKEFKKDRASKHLFNIFSRCLSKFLQGGALAANQYLFLRFTLNDDRAADKILS